MSNSLLRNTDLLQTGAISLSNDNFTRPIERLKHELLLGEIKNSPVLLPSKDKLIQSGRMSRERIDTL